MLKFFKVAFFTTTLTIILSSCSTSEKAALDKSSSSMYPEWYSTAEFASDSTAFHGFATAISSDSVVAIANAELQARANLENAIAYKMEEVRSSLEEGGSSMVTNSDFILTMRNAHQAVQEAAEKTSGEARANDQHFKGFARVTISKAEFRELMKSGFRGKTNYWETFSTSSSFIQEMN
ncbi:hypothetical protein [Gracilimonas sp.]|uniref:hypothetical protein n=1 Tax=Gracilimonas sp. TaxID=1974203 RepID=UPI0032EBC03B